MIEKGIWVKPTKGDFGSETRFLCVSDPYYDPEEWGRQKDYWKNKYSVELSEKELVKVQLFKAKIAHKQSGEMLYLTPSTKEPYVYPIECLKENRMESEAYEKLERRCKELEREKDELQEKYRREDLKNLKEAVWAADGYLERLDQDKQDGKISEEEYQRKKKSLLKEKWDAQHKALILKDWLEEAAEETETIEEAGEELSELENDE